MSFFDVKTHFFYNVKPILPRWFQLFLRRRIALYKRKKFANIWPINELAARPPDGWKGWPEGKKFAFVLQHDVDNKIGHDNCTKLMDLEEGLGVRSTFFIVPERYPVSPLLLQEIKDRGFGLGVHGLKHDGKLFKSYEIFVKRSARINEYLHAWNVSGYSSPSMLRKLEWMHHLNMEYSTSTFDTDPFEPQPDSGNTIFPFLVRNKSVQKGFVEIPYTLPQDFTLYIILKEKNSDIWKKKLDWIVQKKGMALLNTHPDYLNFHGTNPRSESYPVVRYIDFIKYLQATYAGQYWHALHKDIAAFASQQSIKTDCVPLDTVSTDKAGSIFRKKVCIIAKYGYPLDTRLAQQANFLISKGVGLDILCLSTKGDLNVEIKGDLVIYRLMKKPFKENFFGYLFSTVSFGLLSFAKLIRLSFKNDYKVIIIHTLPEFLVFVGLFHRLFGKAIILDGRDITVELLSSRWKTKASGILRFGAVLIEKLCMKLCNDVITASPGFKRQLVKRGISEKKITVIVNTADTNIFRNDAKRRFYPIHRGASFIYHGTVSPRFGIAVAIDAMPTVLSQIPDSKLFVYGYYDKKYRWQIEKNIRSQSLEKNVFLLDPLPLFDIYQKILTMDMGIVSYLSDSFMNLALSTKVFEYVASGLPVVASRLKSTEEFFNDQSIQYAKPNDPKDLAEKVIDLAMDPIKRKNKSLEALKQFALCSDGAMNKRFFGILQKYLSQPI